MGEPVGDPETRHLHTPASHKKEMPPAERGHTEPQPPQLLLSVSGSVQREEDVDKPYSLAALQLMVVLLHPTHVAPWYGRAGVGNKYVPNAAGWLGW